MRSGGFSLVELMTVVAIVAVLAVVAVPSMSQLMATTRVKSASSSLYIAMTKARSEAIKRNANVTIEPISGSDWDDGWRIRLSSDASKIFSNESAMKDSVSIEPKGMALASIVFLRSGRARDPGTSTCQGAPICLQVSDSKYSKIVRCIQLDSSGRPNVKETACSTS